MDVAAMGSFAAIEGHASRLRRVLGGTGARVFVDGGRQRERLTFPNGAFRNDFPLPYIGLIRRAAQPGRSELLRCYQDGADVVAALHGLNAVLLERGTG